jgi:uncharacterized protein YdaU (DUF1376 family)
MAEFPQLPIHVQRWLAELPDLTLEEHGLYFLAVLHMWLQPDCGMPDDPEWLRKKLKIHSTKWQRLWPRLRSFMVEMDGRLYQKTLGIERTYLREKSEKARTNAAKRWESFRANLLNNKEPADATQHKIFDAPTPTPTLAEEEKKEGKKIKKDARTRAKGSNLNLAEKQEEQTMPIVKPPKPPFRGAARNGKAWTSDIKGAVESTLIAVGANPGFEAHKGSPEYNEWINYAKRSGHHFLHKFLINRTDPAPFPFESQWPPDFVPEANGKAAS